MKKLLEANTAYGRRRVSEVFSDFCELAALAIRNSVDLNGRADREAAYMRIIDGYTPEEAGRFAQVFADVTLKFEAGFSDALGELYMSLDLGNERLGQFFTPYDVRSLVAKMTIGDYTEKLAGQSFITVSEPTCGSGGMIVALAEALRDAGINYQQAIHVTAQDLEPTAVHMTYIQLTLLHIPAVVIHGDTLTLEQQDIWYTPAHILGGWSSRLKNRETVDALASDLGHIAPVIAFPTHTQPLDSEGIA